MSFVQRLLRQPQNVWLRWALFQVHLWTGIGVGIYLLVISVSGSALVFRTELHRKFTRPPVTVTPVGSLMTEDQLKEVAYRTYPGYEVTNVWKNKNADQAVEIWLNRNGKVKQRIFNPYTGADMGASEPAGVRLMLWLADLHDNLLYGDKGRFVNGVGSIFLALLCFTGAVIWWPGLGKLRRSLTLELKTNWKRLNWSLHNVIGLWTFAFVFLWAISGIYLVWPDPFAKIVDYFEPFDHAPLGDRLGDDILRWVARLHFGRFYGWPIKTVWTLVGLVPLALFITGALMWWNRVLRPAARQNANLNLE